MAATPAYPKPGGFPGQVLGHLSNQPTRGSLRPSHPATRDRSRDRTMPEAGKQSKQENEGVRREHSSKSKSSEKKLANESEPFTSYQEESGAGKSLLSKNPLYKETYFREVVGNSSSRRRV